MLVVAQVRHALQHAVAIGACSAARFMIGSMRVVVPSSMCPSVVAYAVSGAARAWASAPREHGKHGQVRVKRYPFKTPHP
jgi:hypothetical protein